MGHLKQAADDRTRLTDRRAADHALPVGTHVYLRNRVLGRNKIQDYWRPELHRVTARPYPDQHVYVVLPLAGGAERVVNRKELLPTTAPVDLDPDPQRSPVPSVHSGSDSESDSEDEFWVVPPPGPPVPQPRLLAPPPARPVPAPRRSQRLAAKLK